ncbi:MAG: SRPBCC family protein, partial [Mycobacteriales bacterium]
MDLSAMTVEVSHRFAAAPADVYALLTDVARMAGLGPEHQAARWTDAGRTRFTGVNRLGDRQWQVTCVV